MPARGGKVYILFLAEIIMANLINAEEIMIAVIILLAAFIFLLFTGKLNNILSDWRFLVLSIAGIVAAIVLFFKWLYREENKGI